MAEKLLEFCS